VSPVKVVHSKWTLCHFLRLFILQASNGSEWKYET